MMFSARGCNRTDDKVSLFFAAGIPMQIGKTQPWVWFPRWAEVLDRESMLPIRRQQFKTAIISYLRYCKDSGQKATVHSAREFIERTERERPLGQSELALWKEALRWFFITAKQQTSSNATPHPALSREGSGGPQANRSNPFPLPTAGEDQGEGESLGSASLHTARLLRKN